MALVVKDRVKEATTTTGTGTISLDGAATGFQTFVAGIGTTNTTYYAIVDNNTGDYEVGIGTITDATPDTLSRDTILESSNAGSAVNLQAGTKDVFCTYPAEKSVYLDSSGQLILDGTAITATASELNFVDGVTSSIQTQIDSFANSLEGVKNDYVYTATASQTVFSGADDNTNTLVIDLAGLVNVFLNGVRLIRDTDYTVSAAGDSITLTTGATVNDLLEVEVFGNFTGQSGAEVGITGGLIDGVDIGNTTAGDGTFVDLTATGTTTLAGATTSADITFGDNDKAIFGAGSDLQIYHDGSNSYIAETGTGNLKILGDNIYLKNSADTETALRYIPSGEIRLYYANAEKLTTTNTGIDVTGTVTADGLTVDTDGIVYDSGNVGIGATSPDIFSFGSTYKAFAVQNTTSNGNNVQYLTADGTGSSTLQWTNQTYRRAAITDDSSSNLKFSTNGSNSSSTGITERMRINSNGDISFYEETGTTAKLFWDASAESLGIGTTSPAIYGVNNAEDLVIGQGDGNHGITISSFNTSNGTIAFSDTTNATVGRGFVDYDHNIDAMSFGTLSSERMRIDSSGRVGIGTSSPSVPLEVNVSGAGDVFKLTRDAGANGELNIDFNGANANFNCEYGGFTFETASAANAMTITSTGLVGIGTSSPIYDLQVGTYGSDGDSTLALASTSTGTGSIRFGDGTSGLEPNAGKIVYDHSNNGMQFHTAASERMRIDSSGNVGIGTSPATDYTLHTHNASGSFVYNKFTNSTTGNGGGANGLDVGISGVNALIYNFENGNIQFATNATERMRIDSSGHVGIGTTNPSYPVDAKSTTNGDIIFRAVHQGSGSVAFNGNYVSSSGTAYWGYWIYNGSAVGSITSAGSSTAYNTTSDYRLKEDMQPMTGAIERVNALNPVNFAWKVDGSRVDGFLAHEAQAVVPEAVHGTKDAMRDEEYEVTPAVLDEGGNVVTEAVMGTRSVPDYQGIDQSKLVPLLTAALQEAITKIEDLEARVATLEGN